MTESTETGVAPAQPDTFAAVLALIELAVDPKAVQARLRELRSAMKAAEEAQIDLQLARQQHDAAIAKARAEIDAERQKWREQNAKLEREQELIAEERVRHRETQEKLDRMIGRRTEVVGPNTLTREFFGHDPDDEPEIETSSHTERVPSPSSLTRTNTIITQRPKPRNLRRGL